MLRQIKFLAAFCAFISAILAAETAAAVVLWPAGEPGSEASRDVPEKTEEGKSDIYSVHQPSITPYLPEPRQATGTAVIVAPGGSHRVLCLGHEGYALGQWLADHGIAAFAAMKSDPGRADPTDSIERESSRPDFQGLIYPGKSGTFTVEAGMPPAFIVFGQHDRPDISRGKAEVYLKYHATGLPAEMHVYANAGHGFGYRPDSTGGAGDWPLRFREWLVDSKLLVEVKTAL